MKISFDQLFYYSELISKLIEKFNPSEITVADSNKILIGNNFIIQPQISVIKFLLKTYSDNLHNIKINYVAPNQNEKLKNLVLNNFEKLRFINIKYFILIYFINIFQFYTYCFTPASL